MMTMIFILLAYLLGSISFALVASWVFNLPDPRTYGSGNPGATNVLRSGKKAAAVLTLLGDAGKGWLAIILTQNFTAIWSLGDETTAAVGIAVLLGHIFPVFLRFEGGKGVATAVGILLGLNLAMGLLAILTWIIVAVIWRISSLAALMAAASAGLWLLALNSGRMLFLVLILTILVYLRHWANIERIKAGTEPKIGAKKA